MNYFENTKWVLAPTTMTNAMGFVGQLERKKFGSSLASVYEAMLTELPKPKTSEIVQWVNWSAMTGDPRASRFCEAEIASVPMVSYEASNARITQLEASLEQAKTELYVVYLGHSRKKYLDALARIAAIDSVGVTKT